MSFIDERFPTDISYGSSGGPSWLTQIITHRSGHEVRNQIWSRPRYAYDVAYGVKLEEELEELIAFFHYMRGRTHTFRYKDHSDYTAVLESITNPGSGSTVQLLKTYHDFERDITLPVGGTGHVFVDSVEDTGCSIDTSTGVVTLSSPLVGGEVLEWTGEFDVPCRFDVDSIQTRFEDYQSGATSCPLIEVRV